MLLVLFIKLKVWNGSFTVCDGGVWGKESRSNQGVKVKGEFNGAGKLENKVQKQGHTQEIQEGANPKSESARAQKWVRTRKSRITETHRECTKLKSIQTV